MPVADAEAYLPAPGRFFGDPQVDVGDVYIPTEDYVVLGLRQTERFPPDGRVIPTIETAFVVPGVPGTFVLYIDNYAFTHADPLSYLRGRSAKVRRLYALPELTPPDPEEL